MAIGGSTNAVLHLLAIAHAASIPLSLEDFEAIRSRVPVLCDLNPRVSMSRLTCTGQEGFRKL